MRRAFVVWFVLVVGISGCGGNEAGNDKLSVVASFYPVAEAATRVGGEHVRVTNLTPTGVEPHELELTTDQVDRIEDADVVLYVGVGFQPAVASAAKRAPHSVDVASEVVHEGADDEGDDAHEHGGDAHFWLDPTLMAEAVDQVERALSDADPQNADAYRANAGAYKADLVALDAEYAATLSRCSRKEFVTAHAAFHFLAKRYGLEQHSISGVEPESEPDPQHLADLAEQVRDDGITTIFYEELVPRDFADTLARETGVKTAVLSPLEGLTKQEQAADETYLSVMRRNLRSLALALGCGPPASER